MKSRGAQKFAALVGSMLVHAAFVAPMMRSDKSHTALEPVQTESSKQFIANVFFLQDPAAIHLDDYRFVPTFETPQAITLPVPTLSEISAVAADSFEKSDQIENAVDFAKVEHLQGIYIKQIADRITRVLQMAAAQVKAEASGKRCIVHVIQNESGDVVDVDMDECEREPIARDQLASAIRAASPLPPPPEGLAMGSYLTIDASAL